MDNLNNIYERNKDESIFYDTNDMIQEIEIKSNNSELIDQIDDTLINNYEELSHSVTKNTRKTNKNKTKQSMGRTIDLDEPLFLDSNVIDFKKRKIAEQSSNCTNEKQNRSVIEHNYSQASKNHLSAQCSNHKNNKVMINQKIENKHRVTLEHSYSKTKQTLSQNVNNRSIPQKLVNPIVVVDVSFRETITNVQKHYAGQMNVICIHCGAKHFYDEKVQHINSFDDCCNHGKVKLQHIQKFPVELQNLFEGNHQLSSEFFSNIRRYNSSLSFASFNANIVDFNNRRPGPYCFKIQGSIYYQINTSLNPQPDESPSYGQLFIYDENEATKLRLKGNDLNFTLMNKLDHMMREHNIFAKSYIMMDEEIKMQNLQNLNNSTPVLELQLAFTQKEGLDPKRYNIQKCNEVAAIFTTDADGNIPESHVVIRNKNTKELKRVSSMNPNVEPWTYPLYYPYGTQGWHKNLKKTNGRSLTRLNYVRNTIAIRNGIFNPYINGRRLFQQYVVDSYVKIERDRINWCNLHQKELRAESYQGLIDYVNSENNTKNYQVGKIVILPSTFTGSPRNMIQKYQDSMSITREYGKPDLFITMTCNPNWPEIKENLGPGQQPSDRPDICSRVFNVKKDALLDMIIKKKLFGEVEAYVYTIEFQKRGLPHIHLLVTLKKYAKLHTVEQVDKFISAEIPDPDINPNLHEIVMKHMIHGPCGNWCFKDGKCSKHFPKVFQDETLIDDNNYPQYRRRNNKKRYERPGNYIVDNRHVVPFNPTLLLTFDCHINVEVVSRYSAVKYLFKYILKGHDAAAVTISEKSNDSLQTTDTQTTVNHDEIKMYIESRYVSPVEACWRIFSFPLYKKSHTVTRLPVHLPNQQIILLENDPDETNVDNLVNQTTMLLDYFALNERDEEARKLTYVEIPKHYTFKIEQKDNKKVRSWKRRQAAFKCIGRMYSVSPSAVELFHLRLLLLYVKGAKSFDDLKTVNNVRYDTFIQTCIALHLIEDDNEWKNCMEEASFWMMPQQLRRLFIRILIHCNPLNPTELYEKFKTHMSQDYKRYVGLQEAERKTFKFICRGLQIENRNVSDFFNVEDMLINCEEEYIDEEILQNAVEKGDNLYKKLNDEQKTIVDTIINSVLKIQSNTDNYDHCFFIDGPGGTGKTFIYNTIFNILIGNKRNVCTMAFTGIAATLLPFGKTVHKTFGLPVPLFSDSSSNIKIQSKEAEALRNTDVFIWDEAPMAPRYALEIIDKTLRDFMKTDVPFGGKIFILGGDFRQLLPVQRYATRTEIVNLSIKNSKLWNHFIKFELKQNMRCLATEIEFSKFLLELGNGNLNDVDNNVDISRFPNECIQLCGQDIIQDTYGTILKEKRFKEIINYTILSSRNDDVNELNIKTLNLLDIATEKIYTSIDSTENCDNGALSESLLPEYLNTLNPLSLPPYELRLRQYSVVMLIRNLSVNEGLCNGTRLLILQMTDNALHCEILTGDRAGEIVFLSRITLYSENDFPFTFKRRQFPIKLAFSMTINKAQGQTFNKVSLDLRRDVFNHGQLYVALSRVRSWDAIKIYLGDCINMYFCY